ncbi:MAG: hypothetical protein ACP59X_17645 [Solidesulfovibrio sp. DCME]|uniref:hypothetical protein n=1 Tax=Solidesulfovibrio sp. DCME TaxID=3447380 RepID=UPI003D13A598
MKREHKKDQAEMFAIPLPAGAAGLLAALRDMGEGDRRKYAGLFCQAIAAGMKIPTASCSPPDAPFSAQKADSYCPLSCLGEIWPEETLAANLRAASAATTTAPNGAIVLMMVKHENS